DGRIDAGERADRAGDGAGGDLGPRRLEASPVALELDIVAEKLEAEGGRLGMDAVATADTRRRLVLEGTPFQHRKQPVDIVEQDVGRTCELNGQTCVQHVGRRHTLVNEARLRSDMLGEIREEGDHVVLGLALDLVDPLDLEAPALPDRFGRIGGDYSQLRLCIASVRLNLEPDPELRLRLPDLGHLGAAVTRYHLDLPLLAARGR